MKKSRRRLETLQSLQDNFPLVGFTMDKIEQIQDHILKDYKYSDGEILAINHKRKHRIGLPINTHTQKNGYCQVIFHRKKYLKHRVIFFLCHGYLPKFIDHINRDKTDNRIENLRGASSTENRGNTLKLKNNTSGFKGVTRGTKNGKWRAAIVFNKKYFHIGTFSTKEEAAAAYDQKAKELYGSFANINF